MAALGAIVEGLKAADEAAVKVTEKAVETAAETVEKAGEKITKVAEGTIEKVGSLADADLSGLPGRGGLANADLFGLPGRGSLADADLSGLPSGGSRGEFHSSVQEKPAPTESNGKGDVEKDTDAGRSEKEEVKPKEGGSYKEVKENSDGSTHEVHHMPADSISPLEHGDGPAIKMEKYDHQQTASYGSSKEAREYRAKQQELIKEGKFQEAIQMDIDDIHEKFGAKYDDAISEMMDYVDQLKKEGTINA